MSGTGGREQSASAEVLEKSSNPQQVLSADNDNNVDNESRLADRIQQLNVSEDIVHKESNGIKIEKIDLSDSDFSKLPKFFKGSSVHPSQGTNISTPYITDLTISPPLEPLNKSNGLMPVEQLDLLSNSADSSEDKFDTQKENEEFPTLDEPVELNQLQEISDASDVEWEGSDEEREKVKNKKAEKAAKRTGRKWQSDQFQEWAAKQASSIINNPSMLVADDIPDERRSSKDLLRYTTKSIISDPREYQLELYQRAKEKNTIAVLDTGSGKTLIATLLIRHTLDQELEHRAQGGAPRVCIFLVANVTLVFQQAAVLECNLDAKIGRYCGEMGVDLWNKEQWDSVFMKDDVIVATADTIFNCLTHAFLKMPQVNLLVFDECHHAKKSHVYARIMKDFYNPVPEEKRPRVFGMTASPVDARIDVTKAAFGLETHLNSEICTASDLSLLQKVIQMPNEEALMYPHLQPVFLTDLLKKLVDFKEVDCLQPIYRFSKAASSELGPWCADEVWRFSLTEIEHSRLERRIDIKAGSGGKRDDAKVSSDLRIIRAAREVVAKHKFSDNPTTKDLSGKILTLLRYLQKAYRDEGSDMKCIIFVTRRYTAKVLARLFERFAASFPTMRIGVLFGTSGFSLGDDSMTFKEQTFTLHKFRKGSLNCLIATAVAEEGLDIPDCNLVIRFDLYSTMIQYIQSRGRARHTSSKYIHMAEAGNTTHMQLIKDVKEAEKLMKKFCSILPADRLLDIPTQYVPAVTYEDDEDYQITIESTGAKLTLSSSMQILNHFVDKLFSEGHTQFRPLYVLQPVFGRGYKCEVVLPEESPISSVEGPPRASKSGAKQAAAFETCKKLLQKKYLDDRLLPTVKDKIRPLMANAHLAVDLYKVNAYNSKIKAPYWDMPKPTYPEELYFTCWTLKPIDAVIDVFQPLCLITRKPMPKLPNIPLYNDKGDKILAVPVRIQNVVKPTEELIAKLNKFTDRFFVDVFNKVFEIITEEMPYWLLPLQMDMEFAENSAIDDIVDWELVENVMREDSIDWNMDKPNELLLDKFFIDKGQGSRRFFTHEICPELTIFSPLPAGSCTAPYCNNIVEYSFSAGKKGWERWKDDVPEVQPVLKCDRVLHRINQLDAPTLREKTQCTTSYICASPFRISWLPPRLVKMGLAFPSITYRLDGYLHAWEVCKLLGVEISLDVALEAITKDSDNTSEHSEEQVNKQRGMTNNYERLEFLGDVFLKVATTIALYSQHPEDDEFDYHVKRMLLVCNKTLFNQAKDIKLYRYIQTEGFSRRQWYPAIKMLKGKGTTKDANMVKIRTHHLGDKTIADVCEALIGAALEDKGFDMAVRLITNLLKNENHHQIFEFADYYKMYKIPEYQVAESNESQKELARKVEAETGYKFQYPRVLRSAFTHSSVPSTWEKVPNYQRLEFLGDALIDLACVQYLWKKYPGKDPQWFTEHKMSMINNKFQGMLCVKLGFNKHIRYIGGHMDNAIRDYVTLVHEAQEIAGDAVDFWTDLKAPPKVLPDVLEAYVGALFVDSGFKFEVVEEFFEKYVLPYFRDMSLFDNFAGSHPVTQLTSRINGFGCDDWRFLTKEIKEIKELAEHNANPNHIFAAVAVHTEFFTTSVASTLKNARMEVAQKGLDKLHAWGDDAKAKFLKLCNCQARRDQEAAERAKYKIQQKELKSKGIQQTKGTRYHEVRLIVSADDNNTTGKAQTNPTPGKGDSELSKKKPQQNKEQKEVVKEGMAALETDKNTQPLKIFKADDYADAATQEDPKLIEAMNMASS